MEEMIQGAEIQFGRKKLIVPPLTFGLLRKLEPQLELLNSADKTTTIADQKYIDAMFDIIHAALQRNYPNMARSEIEENLDLGNVRTIMSAITVRSGLTSSGEATPGR
jgi:hypothetical protein